MSLESFVPLVFISYSHDSREHKQWVLELAQELRSKYRVEVILDQWDLEHGDDIARFMRESVNRCDRVLMICTETYVEKADAGKGGVGYEAMIVDGELIRDLGTKKFIPVIRQSGEEIRLPKSVGTRRGANLSEDANRGEELELLVERLHKIPPPTKPALGGGPTALSISQVPLLPAVFPTNPSDLYDAALALARSGDLVAWRRLISEKKAEVSKELNAWRAKWQQKPRLINEELVPLNIEGLRAHDALFAVALAGIESGVDKFNRQAGIVHDLLEPSSWERAGLTVLCDFPQTAVFAFQALLGAFAIHSEQPQLIFELANQRLKRKYEQGTSLLWETSYLVGWPESLGGNCNPAWDFLWSLGNQIPWVADKLGGETHFRECLCGHYFLLSYVEFINRLGISPDLRGPDSSDLSVPTYFILQPELSATLRSILFEKQQLLNFAERNGVSREVLRGSWPQWVRNCQDFLAHVSQRWHRIRVGDDYVQFMEDLLR